MPLASRSEYENLFVVAKSIECRVIEEVEHSVGITFAERLGIPGRQCLKPCGTQNIKAEY